MIQLSPPLRLAAARDAPLVAVFFNMANDGPGHAIWKTMCEADETPEDLGIRMMQNRIASGEVVVVDQSGGPAAGLISAHQKPPTAESPVHLPAPMRALDGLKQRAQDTWFITSVAVLPHAQGQGLGRRLLGLAEEMAVDAELDRTSLLVLEHNEGARRLYDKLGYREEASDRIELNGWPSSPKQVLLMQKAL